MISYPAEGNDACRQVEDGSYWFAHRNACIVELMRLYPPGGAVYDIGGGNGFVSLALQQAGFPTVLVEPGNGAFNAVGRGVARIVHSTLEDVEFAAGSLDAVGAFDVIEHIERDDAFVSTIRTLLRPGGRLYCTVPAIKCLWSVEDVRAGHFRRYTQRTLAELLRRNSLDVEFLSPAFAWLIGPVWCLRAMPHVLGFKAHNGGADAMKADHSLPRSLEPLVRRCHAWELRRLAHRNPLPFGTSLLCVAKRSAT
jgi:SAM-dependent methyltransferase